jgi:hypothetical protein
LAFALAVAHADANGARATNEITNSRFLITTLAG